MTEVDGAAAGAGVSAATVRAEVSAAAEAGSAAGAYAPGTAVVTGGASPRGIGFAVAAELARAGHPIVLLDVNADVQARAAELAERYGVRALGIAADLTEETAVREALGAVDEFAAEAGPVQVLVNNAGIASPTRIGEITLEQWRQIFDINLTGMFLLTQALGGGMAERGYGRIVNMSSVSAQQGGGDFAGAHYAASKAAVIGFTKAVARELAPHGVAVNAVAPGLIDTDITSSALREAEDRGDTRMTARIPARRAGTPDDVASAVAYLCTPQAGYVIGQLVAVNGGLYV